jgi:hypothetical protein
MILSGCTTVKTHKKSFKSSRTGFALWLSFLYPLIAQAAPEIHFYENFQQLKFPSYRNSFQDISIKNSIVKSPILRAIDLSSEKTDFDDIVKKVKAHECYQNSQTIFLSSKEGFVFKGEHDFDDKNVMISSPIWESNSESSAIKTKGIFYAIGDRDKRYPSASLSINADKIYLENMGFYGLLDLDALEVFFLDSSNIGGRGLKASGKLTVNQDVDLICQNIDLKGDMDNKGTIRVFDKLDIKGKSLKNGSGNDKKGIIEAEEFFFHGDGDSKLDNRYGSIKAGKSLECRVAEIICGDCIAQRAAEGDPNVLLGLGFVRRKEPHKAEILGNTSGSIEGTFTKDGYGEYYLSNNSFIQSLGQLTLKASKNLLVHYGHVKSRGKMTLESPCIELLAGSVEGKDDILLQGTNSNNNHLFLKRNEMNDISIGSFREILEYMIISYDKTLSLYGACRTSLESYIYSEGNVYLNHLQKVELIGSSIKSKKVFYLENTVINPLQQNNLFNLLPYEGFYSLKNQEGVILPFIDVTIRHQVCFSPMVTADLSISTLCLYLNGKHNVSDEEYNKMRKIFSDPSKIRCDGALIINDNHLNLNFDKSILEATRVEINAQALQGNNSVLINQENPRNDSINVGEDYFEVKIEGENKRKIKKQLESMENICGTSKDNPILVVDMEHLSKG